MRILHTSDWHLGKSLQQESLLEDQALLLEQIVSTVTSQDVDVVIVSGDIFDRANPPKEAMELCDRFTRRIYIESDAALVIISGNHDAPERVAYNSALQDPKRCLIRGPMHHRPEPLLLEDDHGLVAISALPYVDTYAAREYFRRTDITTPQDVITAQIEEARGLVPKGARWVVSAHAFVHGAKTSLSERPLDLIGGLETVSPTLFTDAAYVGLGHLHRAQSAGADCIRYSGSPMGFDFDEAGETKSMSLVTLGVSAMTDVQKISLRPNRELRVVEGPLSELIAAGRDSPTDDFVKAVLTDEGALLDPQGQLRAVYPNLLRVEQRIHAAQPNLEPGATTTQVKDPEGLVGNFIEFVRGNTMRDDERKVVRTTIAAVQEDGEV